MMFKKKYEYYVTIYYKDGKTFDISLPKDECENMDGFRDEMGEEIREFCDDPTFSHKSKIKKREINW